MKTEELMIGNFIEHITGIIEVDCDDFELIKNDPCEYMPIPLTEQWLIDFGFKKKLYKTTGIVIECVYYKLGEIVVYLVSDFFEIELITVSGQFNLFKKWNYVHQLQNLYFSLLGEELIKTNAQL